MITVTEIMEAVKSFGVEKKREFLARLSEVGFEDGWDLQMAADVQARRLYHLWEQALDDIKAGRTKPLDEVLNDAWIHRSKLQRAIEWLFSFTPWLQPGDHSAFVRRKPFKRFPHF